MYVILFLIGLAAVVYDLVVFQTINLRGILGAILIGLTVTPFRLMLNKLWRKARKAMHNKTRIVKPWMWVLLGVCLFFLITSIDLLKNFLGRQAGHILVDIFLVAAIIYFLIRRPKNKNGVS